MIFFLVLSRMPFPLLYILADILYFFSFHVIGYRKKVVMNNLRKSFPEKSEMEIKEIARRFYINLSDTIVETIKAITITEKEFTKRVKVNEAPFLHKYYEQGQSVILMAMHQSNWEWGFLGASLFSPFQMDAVYSKVQNPFFEKLMLRIRSRFGAHMIEKQELYKQLIARKEITRSIGLISDQGPHKDIGAYWTKFLNQETAFFVGAEKVARKMKYPVIFVYGDREKRGHYIITYKEIAAPPFLPNENYILESFVRALEEVILHKPENWLWSHRRWKYKNKPAKIKVDQ